MARLQELRPEAERHLVCAIGDYQDFSRILGSPRTGARF